MRKEISSIIKEWKNEAGVNGVVLLSSNPESSSKITIYTDNPELMVVLSKKYKERLQEINSRLVDINFVETGSLYVK